MNPNLNFFIHNVSGLNYTEGKLITPLSFATGNVVSSNYFNSVLMQSTKGTAWLFNALYKMADINTTNSAYTLNLNTSEADGNNKSELILKAAINKVINSNSPKIKEIENRLDTQSSSISNLSNHLNTAEVNISNLNNKTEEIEDDLTEQSNQILNLSNDLDSAEADITTINQRLDELGFKDGTANISYVSCSYVNGKLIKTGNYAMMNIKVSVSQTTSPWKIIVPDDFMFKTNPSNEEFVLIGLYGLNYQTFFCAFANFQGFTDNKTLAFYGGTSDIVNVIAWWKIKGD